MGTAWYVVTVYDTTSLTYTRSVERVTVSPFVDERTHRRVGCLETIEEVFEGSTHPFDATMLEVLDKGWLPPSIPVRVRI